MIRRLTWLLVAGTAFCLCAATAIATFTSKSNPRTTATHSGLDVIMRTPGGLLEISRIKAYEHIKREDPKTVFWNQLDLGTTVSEIDVPVLFRYHVELANEWPLHCDAAVCVVRAGEVKPSLPPAIYSDEIRKLTTSGWGRFNKADNLAALEANLTSTLSDRAASERNLSAAKAEGRKTISEFVQTWMTRSHPELQSRRLVVLFPGESLSSQQERTD